MNNLFSVIIPTYKRPRKLSLALDSLRRQKKCDADFEVIIINDGPIDGYDAINFTPSLNINYQVNRRNLGVSESRNKAAHLATGQWLVFLDDDDQMVEDYLSTLSEYIKKNPSSQCFWSGVEIRKTPPEKNEIRLYTSKNKTSSQILEQFLTIGLSYGVAIRRDFFLQIGMLDTNFYVGEDTELFIRAIEHKVNACPIESVGIIKNEEHPDRLSFNYKMYSEQNIYEKIFTLHQAVLCQHKKIYSNLLFWAYRVHFLNGNIRKGQIIFDQIVLMGFPSSHILHCRSEGMELSGEYLLKTKSS